MDAHFAQCKHETRAEATTSSCWTTHPTRFIPFAAGLDAVHFSAQTPTLVQQMAPIRLTVDRFRRVPRLHAGFVVLTSDGQLGVVDNCENQTGDAYFAGAQRL